MESKERFKEQIEAAKEGLRKRLDEIEKEEKKVKVRRDPAGRYIAIAFNSITVRRWLSIHGIAPANVKIITSMKDARGVGYDLIAVCFPDWGDRADREFHQAVQLLEGRIIAYRYSDRDKPVVEKGRIVGWTSIHGS